MPDEIRTVNLNLGNAAEANMVAINAAHIGFVKLMGAMSSLNRKMEVHMASGAVIGMSFDDPDHAEAVFAQVVDTLNKTIPDHVTGVILNVPQNAGG